jgi:hypothetical protein
VSERDGAIHVVVEGAEGWGGRLLHVEDRVQAAGGHLATDELRVAVVLPLASTA